MSLLVTVFVKDPVDFILRIKLKYSIDILLNIEYVRIFFKFLLYLNVTLICTLYF